MTIKSATSVGIRDQISPEEWQVRVDLAACYRLAAHYQWDDLIFTHISARVPGAEEHFLLNPFGMLFEEITASSLVRIDLNGEKVSDSPYEINPAGFTIHSAIHEGRSDARCVIHLHTLAGVAVSCQKDGLLPISQQAAVIHGGVTYHDYEGIALTAEEKVRLVADLGSHDYMILRNHGLLACGGTVADAFLRMYMLETACRVQVMAQGGGELISVPPSIVDAFTALTGRKGGSSGGHLAWPALLRKLDRLDPSYRD